jgi:hypothetical protein
VILDADVVRTVLWFLTLLLALLLLIAVTAWPRHE